ncbi:glucan endo-1,3-beta-glucosidase, acidic-like isoform X2 [Coffea arabica]|uniref:Glucan endo-1,3-beta-glucosidase, acidic-like isoform X2 n=1 Tax=Coffea arabica TaxID=13443 RepID=A0ABM4UVX8_COFAR
MTTILLLLGLFLLGLRLTGVQSIGVCYGLNGNNLPSKQDVINLYKRNGIQRMRIYGPDPEVLNALKGTNIELLVDVPNESIQDVATNPSAAANWVQNNIKKYSPAVKFRYISVGNEVPVGSAVARYVGPAMEKIQKAIASAGLQNQIKVSTSILTALEKEGGSKVNIVVSETGWPSDGNPPAASSANAGTYYKNVIRHVMSGKGTPKKPGGGIETYLFAMFDENQKRGEETEKHFGLFYPNQQPKYGISFK